MSTYSSTALLTDQYELTMMDAALRSGAADLPATFEVFCRRLPPGRRFGVVAGTGRLLDEVERFRFGEDELEFLERMGIVSAPALQKLADYAFSGSISGYREGEIFLPGSPILTVSSTFAEAVLLETLALSVLNYDSSVAAAAARMKIAAGDRTLLEGGGRRAHERAAPVAARAAYICGFDATSNLEAGRLFGVPTGGTIGHAFILAHSSEEEAMSAQFDLLGANSTYLVDTYDTSAGVRLAVNSAGAELAAIRIDSGDLAAETLRARALLDEMGAAQTRIVLSGDLTEFDIAATADIPADGYLVGTELVVGAGAPTAGLVYKLVEIDGRPVHKHSLAKSWRPGRKRAFRALDEEGRAASEVLALDAAPPPERSRPLQVAFMEGGRLLNGGQAGVQDKGPDNGYEGGQAGVQAGGQAGVQAGGRAGGQAKGHEGGRAGGQARGQAGPAGAGAVRAAREHHRKVLAELPLRALELTPGDPCLEVRVESGHGR